MKLRVHSIGATGIARGALALAAAFSGLGLALFNARQWVPGEMMLSVIAGCALAIAIGFSPSSIRGRASGTLEVGDGTLRVTAGSWTRSWAIRDVTGAWTEHGGARVVLRDRFGRTLAVDVETPEEADAMLTEAALGPSVRVTRIPLGGARSRVAATALMFGSMLSSAFGLTLIAVLVRLAMSSHSYGVPLPVALVMGGMAYGSLLLGWRMLHHVRVVDVAVGRDGVLIPRLFRRARRISLANVLSTTVEETAVTIVTKLEPVRLRAVDGEQATAVANAIADAMSRYRPAMSVDRAILDRAGRSAVEWTEHLHDVAARARTYRDGFEVTDLLAIAEDPSTRAEERVAAALIVSRVSEQLVPRLRIAAEGTVRPDLRAAMIAAIEEGIVEDDALKRLQR